MRSVRSAAAVAIKNSVGWIEMAEMAPVCCVNSWTSLRSIAAPIGWVSICTRGAGTSRGAQLQRSLALFAPCFGRCSLRGSRGTSAGGGGATPAHGQIPKLHETIVSA